jgi:para-nitrobenzyl esterase
MKSLFELGLITCCIVLLVACGTSKQQPSDAANESLVGSSWHLVQFVGGDDTKVSPDDKSKYTLTFVSDSEVAVRFDCNRGRATWKSAEPSLIEFGPLAMTRAMCANPSLHDRLVKQWPYIRSYVMKDDHLFLSLMADGGVYEFEPSAAAP